MGVKAKKVEQPLKKCEPLQQGHFSLFGSTEAGNAWFFLSFLLGVLNTKFFLTLLEDGLEFISRFSNATHLLDINLHRDSQEGKKSC